MKNPALSLLVLVCFIVPGGESAFPNSKKDWLIDPNDYLAQITTIPNGQFIQLSNGLVSRTLQLQPNAATISLRNLITGEEFLRSVRPEAEIVIDKVLCKIGGLVGQPIHNYLSTEWLSRMRNDSLAFQFVSYQTGAIRERFPYRKRLEWMPDDLPWPPRGKSLDLRFRPPQDWIPQMAREYPELPKSVLTRLKKLVVIIHYQIYDGIPLICKWVTVENHSSREIRVNTLKSEILAVVEGESSVGGKRQWRLPSLTVETDYAFGGGMSAESCIGKSVFWQPDPLYSTQVNYQRQTPCLLVCRPQYGPAKSVAPVPGSSHSGHLSYFMIVMIGSAGDWPSGRCTASLLPGSRKIPS